MVMDVIMVNIKVTRAGEHCDIGGVPPGKCKHICSAQGIAVIINKVAVPVKHLLVLALFLFANVWHVDLEKLKDHFP